MNLKTLVSVIGPIFGLVEKVWSWWTSPIQEKKRRRKKMESIENEVRKILANREVSKEKLRKIMDKLNVSHHD
jgi:hypothetical protein